MASHDARIVNHIGMETARVRSEVGRAEPSATGLAFFR